MAGNRQNKTFDFLLQILPNVFLGFPKLELSLTNFHASSAPKPKGSNNGDECVIISDSDEDEEQNSQNMEQDDDDDDDDERDDQVGGELFLFTIITHYVI